MEAQSPSVWISTQIVEASLDIDFDVLLTENATIESLLQRFGRCYRKREYRKNEPNIFIFRSAPNNTYDKDLFNSTWNVLQSYNDQLITEQDKQNMINQVFENVKNTNYYQKYQRQKELLEIGYRSLSKIEAQVDFREIINNYIVIPENVFEENKDTIDSLLHFIDDKKNNVFERLKKQAELFDYTIPVQLYGNLKEISDSLFCKRHQIRLLSGYEYFPDIGLTGKAYKSEEGEEPENIL
jgi:CRISPR-associated endonuclease/helicase Cas3